MEKSDILSSIEKGLHEAFPSSIKLDLGNTDACNGQLGLEILIISDDFDGVKLLDRHR